MQRRAGVFPFGRERTAVVLAASLLGIGCGVGARPIPVDPGLTFAVHTVHGGLVVDRMANGDTGIAEPEGGWSSLTSPEFDVHFNGAGGDRRLVGTGPIVIHRGTSDEGPVSGRVEPSWDNQAIRLTLRPASGPPLTTDIFTRVDTGGGMEELTRNAQDSIDLRGSYQAALRDPAGKEVGWLRIHVGPSYAMMATCEGVLPPTVGEGMAIAAAETLDTEISWIGSHLRGVSRPPERRP
jgi:hypothetical protein